MKLSFGTFLKDQFTTQPPVVKADLAGKTVIVLGANTGIGFEATKHFARMHPGRLILACRSQSRGQAALEKIKAQTGCKTAELKLIDLADFASVKRFADDFEREGGRLDIVVANAALNKRAYEATKDGWEASIQVNDLSTPLISVLLLPIMIRTAKEHSTLPRLVVVGSGIHYWADLPREVLESRNILETLGSEKYCTPKVMIPRYPITKLLTLLFVRALNARLDASTPLVVNVVDPGLCASELARDLSGFESFIWGLFVKIVAFTAEEGSRRLVYGAVGEPGNPDKLRGQFIDRCRPVEPSDWVIGAEGAKAQDRIWDELVQILGKVDPRVLTIVDEYLTPSA